MKLQKFMTVRKAAFVLTLAVLIAIPLVILRAQSRVSEIIKPESGAEQQEAVERNSFGQPVSCAPNTWYECLKERQSQQLEGSWDVTVTPVVPPGVPQPPAFHAYATLSRGGALFGSDRTRPFSKQHGTSVHQGGNEFAWTEKEDLFDSTGNFAGTLTVRARIIVTGTNEFVGIGNGEQRDAVGNLVFNRCSRIKGARITVEPLAPQCQSLNPFQ